MSRRPLIVCKPCFATFAHALASCPFVPHGIDMTHSAEARAPVLAAGGIVLREGGRPRIAIVRLRRDKSWVLPKGKLYPGERALAAARREVLEETGHQVSVHGFLGSMLYSIDGRIKIVQFWHMRAVGGPLREPMRDVRAVKWLSLKQAIETLTRDHEKLFLANVGPVALKATAKVRREKPGKSRGQSRGRRRSPGARVAPTAH
jgi:8-oxo-dGTP diphosphatase